MSKNINHPDTLQKAIAIVGNQSALARKLAEITGNKKIAQGHVWKWLHKCKNVPAEYALAIEKATAGEVTRYELRPDLYPREEEQNAA